MTMMSATDTQIANPTIGIQMTLLDTEFCTEKWEPDVFTNHDKAHIKTFNITMHNYLSMLCLFSLATQFQLKM